MVIKVVLVGMSNLFLQGLRRLLDEAQFSIVGEASDLAGWRALLREELVPDMVPDLLLVDLLRLTFRSVALPKDPGCPACAA